jgi:hypothetical protein
MENPVCGRVCPYCYAFTAAEKIHSFSRWAYHAQARSTFHVVKATWAKFALRAGNITKNE